MEGEPGEKTLRPEAPTVGDARRDTDCVSDTVDVTEGESDWRVAVDVTDCVGVDVIEPDARGDADTLAVVLVDGDHVLHTCAVTCTVAP